MVSERERFISIFMEMSHKHYMPICQADFVKESNMYSNINSDMLQTARKQFCLDTCLDWQQYLEHPNQKVYIQKTKYANGTSFPIGEGARRYAGMDSFFKAIMCMGQLFLTVDEQIYEWAVEQFADCAPEWFCEFDNLRKIDEKLKEYGRKISDTHVYYLPAMSDGKSAEGHSLQSQALSSEFMWYEQEEILHFKEGNRFTSAICFSPTQPDVLAVAAMRENETSLSDRMTQACKIQSDRKNAESAVEKDFDQEHMAGMAGASEDGAYLWQIGINVVAECAGKGLAVRLVRQIKEEIIRRGKVPFYGTSESHTISQTVAYKAGFVPAWTEIYVKSIEK